MQPQYYLLRKISEAPVRNCNYQRCRSHFYPLSKALLLCSMDREPLSPPPHGILPSPPSADMPLQALSRFGLRPPGPRLMPSHHRAYLPVSSIQPLSLQTSWEASPHNTPPHQRGQRPIRNALTGNSRARFCCAQTDPSRAAKGMARPGLSADKREMVRAKKLPQALALWEREPKCTMPN